MAAQWVDVWWKPTPDSEGKLVRSINENVLRRKSVVARIQLNRISAANEEDRRAAAAVKAPLPRGRWKIVDIICPGTTREAVDFLIGRLVRDGNNVKLNGGNRSFVFNVRIWAAAKAMDLEVSFAKLKGDLKGYIARGKLGPEEVEAIVAVFETDREMWQHAVHHVAWWFLYQWRTEEEYNALVVECEKHPSFNEAVLVEMKHLEAMAARKAAREERFERTREDNRYRKRGNNRQKAQEARQGLQVTSEETVDWIMGRKSWR